MDHLQCTTVQVAIHEPLNMTSENQALKSAETTISFGISRQAAVLIIHCPDAPARYSIYTVSSHTLMPPAVSRSRAVNYQNCHGLLLSFRPRLTFLSFFIGTLLPDNHRIVDRELLIMHNSASYPRICALCLIYVPRSKRRKVRTYVHGGLLYAIRFCV